MPPPVRLPNIGNVLRNALAVQSFQGAQEDRALRRNLLDLQIGAAQREVAKQQALQTQAPAALQAGLGSPEFAALAATDIDSATKLGQFITSQNEAKQQEFVARTEFLSRAVDELDALSGPAQQQRYQEILNQGRGIGLVFPDAPEAYSPEVGARVKAQLRPIESVLGLKAPETRTFEQGGQKVTQEFNEQTGEFDTIATSAVQQPPVGPQSTVGKLQFDLRNAERNFGSDSPQATALRGAIESEVRGDPPKLSDVKSIRDQHAKLSGDFVTIRDAFNKIQTTPDSAAGDVALIFNFMKIQDPGSVVREGEFATAQNAAGVGEQVRNIYNRLLTGERLSDKQKNDFRSTAEAAFRAQQNSQRRLDQQFQDIAIRAKIDPRDAVLDFHTTQQVAPISDEGAKAADFLDGTIATSETGEQMIVRGGKWIPLQ